MQKNITAKVVAIMALIMTIALPAAAQNANLTAEQIKANADYLYGDGFGADQKSADQNAIADLISKIAVTLSSNFSSMESEMNNNGDLSSTSTAQVVVNSYTQASLTNTQSMIVRTQPQYHVLRYVAKSEMNKIFEQRKEKVFDYLRSAARSEQKMKIDDALRQYYWSLLMLKSMQYPNEVTYKYKGEEHNLMRWIPEQMNDIFDKLEVRLTEADETSATLYITYGGEPVSSLDFTFYNGNGWSMPYHAKNGVAQIELRPGVDANRLRIRYEYEFAGEAQVDSDIESVIKIFRNPQMRLSEVALAANAKGTSLKSAVSKQAAKEMATNAKATNDIHVEAIDDQKPYIKTMNAIIDAVNKRDYTATRDLFTPEGWEMMDKLLHYGKAKMLGQQNFSFFNVGQGRVVCRSLVMSFSFPNNNKTFTEDVTFTFNSDKKIECIAFGLGQEAKTDIFDKCVGLWSDTSKMAIATFLENYKTAFALKRLDYIKSIFADIAVIVTGTVIKKPEKNLKDSNIQNFENDPIVKYNRYSKEQYMEKLEKSFNSNEYINIRFTDNNIEKMGKGGEWYGIQIHQDYYSSHYGDTGYLFLMVDVNDPDNPIIYVRTWQPERDPNINNRLPRNSPDFGIIGPSCW